MEKTLVEQLNDYERLSNLQNRCFDKFCYWIYMREHVYAALRKKVTGAPDRQWGKVQKIFSKNLLSAFFNSVFTKNIFFMKKADVLIYNHSRKMKVNGKYVSIYMDELLKNATFNYSIMELFSLNNVEQGSYGADMYYDLLISGIATVFRSRNSKKINILVEEFTSILGDLEKHFSVTLEKEGLVQTCIRLYCNYKIKKKLFGYVIKKVNPKCLLELVHYHPNIMIANEVCNELGIPIVELQHGTIGNTHIAYNYPTIPKTKQFPTYIYLFSEAWKDNARYPVLRENLRVVGYPFLESWVREATVCKDEKIVLTIVSQPNCGKELSKFANELDKKLNALGINYYIYYKLHPFECMGWKDMYPALLNNLALEVIDDPSKLVYEYFSISNYQIGVGSTATIEGVAFGLRTFILPYEGYKNLSVLYNNGYATIVNNVEEVIRAITSSENQNKDIRFIWEKNAVNNILFNINCLLGRSE